jgi:hypothetical protein
MCVTPRETIGLVLIKRYFYLRSIGSASKKPECTCSGHLMIPIKLFFNRISCDKIECALRSSMDWKPGLFQGS